MEPSIKRRTLRINTVSKDSRGMWEEVKILAPLPPRRCNHSSNIIDNKLLIYGGQDITEGVLSDLWCLTINPSNTIEEKWTKINSEANPGPLCRHSSIVHNRKILILGGTDLITEKGELWLYDPDLNNWEKLNSVFKSIDSHTAVLFEDSMIVFGGYQNGKLSSGLWLFNIKNHTWNCVESSGPAPEERADHSAVVFNDCMYVHGGLLASSDYSADMWKFHVLSQTWTQVNFDGDSPGPVSGHSACLFKDAVLVFGGVRDILKETNEMYAFEFETSSWQLIQTETESKDPVINLNLRDEIRTHFTEIKRKNDPFTHREKRPKPKKTVKPSLDSFDIHKSFKYSNVCFQGRIRGKVPHSRDGHSADVFEDHMIVFGGDRHKMPFNDLYFYSINENLLKKH